MTPPLPQLVSSAAASWRSTTVTSCPALLRYQAVATPTAPAPSTTTGMSLHARSRPLAGSRLASVASLARPASCGRAADAAPRASPDVLLLAIHALGDVARDVAQDLLARGASNS